MEETPGKFRTSHQFSGKKGTRKKQLSLARPQKPVLEQNVDCFRPIITSDSGTDSDETIIMLPHPTTRETSRTETKVWHLPYQMSKHPQRVCNNNIL